MNIEIHEAPNPCFWRKLTRQDVGEFEMFTNDPTGAASSYINKFSITGGPYPIRYAVNHPRRVVIEPFPFVKALMFISSESQQMRPFIEQTSFYWPEGNFKLAVGNDNSFLSGVAGGIGTYVFPKKLSVEIMPNHEWFSIFAYGGLGFGVVTIDNPYAGAYALNATTPICFVSEFLK